MAYKIRGTDEFLHELKDILYYIENSLKAPMAANKLRQKIKYNLTLLKRAPKIFEKITSNLEIQYRRIVVNNYIILYTIDELSKTVYISHIYYNKRNYIDTLL